jgi:hypothetical protein
MARDREVDLERALAGDRAAVDEEISALVDAAGRVSRALDAEPRDAVRERALFVSGAAARRQRFPVARFAVPALALAGSLVLLGALGRGAQPGETFYPVRKVLAPIAPKGVVESPLEEADKLIDEEQRTGTRPAIPAHPQPLNPVEVRACQHDKRERQGGVQRGLCEQCFATRSSLARRKWGDGIRD